LAGVAVCITGAATVLTLTLESTTFTTGLFDGLTALTRSARLVGVLFSVGSVDLQVVTYFGIDVMTTETSVGEQKYDGVEAVARPESSTMLTWPT